MGFEPEGQGGVERDRGRGARGPGRRAGDPLGRRVGDRLAAELLGVLIGDVRAMTGRLGELIEESATAADDETLARAGLDAEHIGWQLAVLASAAGTDVLLARREVEGLRSFLELVRAALERLGRSLELPPVLPRLVPASGAGWEAAWLIGAALFEAGRSGPVGAALEWSLAPAEAGHCLALRPPLDPALGARIEELARCIPAATVSFEVRGCTLVLPGPWLAW